LWFLSLLVALDLGFLFLFVSHMPHLLNLLCGSRANSSSMRNNAGW
jgi:hypothetical protein